jgi:hypothetical protein
MRLFPPELEIGPEDGFNTGKDIFGRKEFGDRLTNIVRSLEGPAVLVLDAPWGTGKTTFVKMWRGELSKADVSWIYFDAFSNDYHEDAFLALAGEIIARAEDAKPKNRRALKNFRKRAVNVAKVLGRAAVHVGVNLATASLVNTTVIDNAANAALGAGKVAGEEAAKAADDLLMKRLESHRVDRKAFESFRNALDELARALQLRNIKLENVEEKIESVNFPMIFIIDELDRCRPPFALELLEKIKHFFSVPGIIFILVCSLEQLEKSVRFAYGDIDAHTYLEKFYHLRFLFPAEKPDKPDLAAPTYLQYLLSPLAKGDNNEFVHGITRFVTEVARVRPISLRRLERIASYVSLTVIGAKYKNLHISGGLCIMKVTNPEMYERARRGTLVFSQVDEILGITAWREQYQPYKRSEFSERAEKSWRFFLNELSHDDLSWSHLAQNISHAGFRQEKDVIPYLCDFIDGFRFPGGLV